MRSAKLLVLLCLVFVLSACISGEDEPNQSVTAIPTEAPTPLPTPTLDQSVTEALRTCYDLSEPLTVGATAKFGGTGEPCYVGLVSDVSPWPGAADISNEVVITSVTGGTTFLYLMIPANLDTPLTRSIVRVEGTPQEWPNESEPIIPIYFPEQIEVLDCRREVWEDPC